MCAQRHPKTRPGHVRATSEPHPDHIRATSEPSGSSGKKCPFFRERKVSPKFFRPKFFRGRPRGMSVPKCLFFHDLEGLTEVFLFLILRRESSEGMEKTPTQIRTFCTNNLCSSASSCLFLFYRGKGDNLYKLFRTCWRKLCFYLGGLLNFKTSNQREYPEESPCKYLDGGKSALVIK